MWRSVVVVMVCATWPGLVAVLDVEVCGLSGPEHGGLPAIGDPSDGIAGGLARQFVALTRVLLDSGSVVAVLERVVHAALEVVPGADLVSITLRSPDGAFHTPVESHPVASELDQLQYQLQEGACVEAARPDGPAMAACDDLAADTRWPRFGPAAAELGYRSLVSTALLPDAVSPELSGALNVYSRHTRAIAVHDRDVLLLLATHASLALASTRAVTRGELQSAQLRRALDSRDAIGQAKGILMARRGISSAEAFKILRKTSQDVNVKLREVAEAVVARPTEVGVSDGDTG
jgi:GAF domain-containing protein